MGFVDRRAMLRFKYFLCWGYLVFKKIEFLNHFFQHLFSKEYFFYATDSAIPGNSGNPFRGSSSFHRDRLEPSGWQMVNMWGEALMPPVQPGRLTRYIRYLRNNHAWVIYPVASLAFLAASISGVVGLEQLDDVTSIVLIVASWI